MKIEEPSFAAHQHLETNGFLIVEFTKTTQAQAGVTGYDILN